MTFKKLKLTTKFLGIGIFLMAILSLGLMGFFSKMFYDQTIESFVSKARSIAMAAESARLEMDEKWQQSIFTVEQARGFYEKGNMDALLNMVPVVTAWRTAMKKAEEGQYELRVPKNQPRNPKNKPDYGLDYAIEGPALEKITKENLKEYYVIDTKRNAVRYFLPIRLSSTCLMCHGDPATSKKLWGIADGKDPSGGTMENWKEGEIHGAFEIIQSLVPAKKEIGSSLLKAFFITIIGLVAVASCYYLLVKKTVVKPIEDVSTHLRGMSQGNADLTQRLFAANEDEIGFLVGNFNAFLEKLQAMIRQVSGNTDVISTASQQLSTISEDMHGNSGTTSEKTKNVYSAADAMNSNLQAISKAMEEATSNINLMASASEEMNITLNEIAKKSEDARTISRNGVDQSKRASEKIIELDQIAQSIGKVTETISEISDQTNLLALNATIEAARAGEAGKGFTIVAQEIKALSYQTGDATNQIKTQIETVQKAITSTLHEIRGLGVVIDDINKITMIIAEAVVEQTSATDEITSNISQASVAISEINERVADSSDMAQHVHHNLAEVNHCTEDVARGSENISTSVARLEEMATELQKMIARFTV